MIVNEGYDIDFSLIIPSRDRLGMLENCLLSFFNKAKRRDHNEAIIVADHDDKSIRNFSDFILLHRMNARILHVHRSEMMIRDYNNYGAQCSTGKYLWMLNDDYEVATDDWDEVLKVNIESFCAANGDRVAYVFVNDGTHYHDDGWSVQGHMGCTCPVITREACEAMNAIMPWQINSWGADISIANIFRRLPKPRMIDLTKSVKVFHHCRHNGTAGVDDVSRRIESISRCQGIGPEAMDVYARKIASIMR